MFVHAIETPVEEVAAGVTRQVLGFDPELMMVRVEFRNGAQAPRHSHEHRQVTYVVSGRFEATLAADTRIIATGDCYFVPPHVPHGVVALTDGVLIDVFTPMRQEFLTR
jgi:quercetin dioxygenase-like cupin family protein